MSRDLGFLFRLALLIIIPRRRARMVTPGRASLCAAARVCIIVSSLRFVPLRVVGDWICSVSIVRIVRFPPGTQRSALSAQRSALSAPSPSALGQSGAGDAPRIVDVWLGAPLNHDRTSTIDHDRTRIEAHVPVRVALWLDSGCGFAFENTPRSTGQGIGRNSAARTQGMHPFAGDEFASCGSRTMAAKPNHTWAALQKAPSASARWLCRL